MKNTTQETDGSVTSFELKIHPELLAKTEARSGILFEDIHSYIQRLLEQDLACDPLRIPHVAEIIVRDMVDGRMSIDACLRVLIRLFSADIPALDKVYISNETSPQKIAMRDIIRHIDELPQLRTLLTGLHKAGRLEGVATIHPDGRIDLMIHQNPKRSYRRKQKPTAATASEESLKS